jgi:hypothetical protein
MTDKEKRIKKSIKKSKKTNTTKYQHIEAHCSAFLERYTNDIVSLCDQIGHINSNIKLNVKCTHLQMDKVLVSYHVLFLIFAKNILDISYQSQLKSGFFFSHLVISPKLLTHYKTEIGLIQNLIKTDIQKVTKTFKLSKTQIDKLNVLVDDRCPHLKNAFSVIILNGFQSLPQEVLKYYNKGLEEHKLLYSSFTGFNTIEEIRTKLNYKCLVEFSLDDIKHKYTLYLSNKTQLNRIKTTVLKRIAVQILFMEKNFGGNVSKKPPKYTIYYTNLKKEVPVLTKGDTEIVFRAVNINTAVTNNRDEITIWRKEELLKSIFHEAVHYYDLDNKSKQFVEGFKRFILSTFKVDENSELVIYEAFTELNANMLNTLFNTFYNIYESGNKSNSSSKINTKHLITSFKKLCVREAEFSLQQVAKIYKLNKYQKPRDFLKGGEKVKRRILKKQPQNIKQFTDVVSYHIIKSIFLFNLHMIYQKNRDFKNGGESKKGENDIGLLADMNFGDSPQFGDYIKTVIMNAFALNDKWHNNLIVALKKRMSLKKHKTLRMTYYNNG